MPLPPKQRHMLFTRRAQWWRLNSSSNSNNNNRTCTPHLSKPRPNQPANLRSKSTMSRNRSERKSRSRIGIAVRMLFTSLRSRWRRLGGMPPVVCMTRGGRGQSWSLMTGCSCPVRGLSRCKGLGGKVVMLHVVAYFGLYLFLGWCFFPSLHPSIPPFSSFFLSFFLALQSLRRGLGLV